MAQIRPLVELRYGRINEPVRIPMYPLLVDAVQTYLAQDISANSSTLTVQNTTGFSNFQYLLVGEPGNENSEIVQADGTTISNNVITLAANTGFAHTAGTMVYVLKFNQVEISNAPTINGVKTVLDTIDLVADSQSTDYNDLASTEGSYYFARYLSTVETVYEQLYTGATNNSIEQSVNINAQTFTPRVSHILNGVTLRLFRDGMPGTLTVGIYATDVNGKPTGAALATQTTDGDTLTTSTSGEDRDITFDDGINVTAGTMYAIVLRAPSGSVGNTSNWRRNETNAYSRGAAWFSSDDGTTWVAVANSDLLFQEWSTENYSPYSDPCPYDGYTIYSARSIIDNALMMINRDSSKDLLTDEYAFTEIDNCQMEVLREFKRWSFMQSFDTIVGTTAVGTWKIAVPDNIDVSYSNKSIYNFRIGKEQDMYWVDKEEWNAIIEGIGYSTLSQDETAGATQIHLVSSKDFNEPSGTIRIGDTQYSYSANDKDTNIITIDDPLADDMSAGQDVFQFESLGYPVYWTIYGGYIYHWPIVGSPYQGRNYYLDYYIKWTPITSDYQYIVLPDPTVVQYYLAYKFLLRLNNGEMTDAVAGMYNQYLARREKMKQKESINRNFILDPNIADPYDWPST